MGNKCQPQQEPPDKVLVQVPGLSIRKRDVAHALVPYEGRVRSNGSEIFDWIDLRDRPDLICTIPEARDWPGMQALLRVANLPDAGFITTGCDSGSYVAKDENGSEIHVAGGYVMFTFESTEQNADAESLFGLAQSIRAGLRPPAEHVRCRFDFNIEPYKSFFGSEGRFGLSIEAEGSGDTAASAGENFNAAAQIVANALNECIVGHLRE
jgi:hypothetical protein